MRPASTTPSSSLVRSRALTLLAGLMLVVSACSAGDDSAANSSVGGQPEATTTSIEDYPDAQTRALRRLAAAPRPVPRSALPPRHLDEERFPESLVDRYRIVSGGPAPDAIASIDEPRFEPVSEVDWLEGTEPVLVLVEGTSARAYPIQVLIWHEIVNDVIGDRAVTVTYCPLCNSGVAFDRTLDGEILDFGTSGALYQSALVMYDRQSESLWTHFDGRAVIGDRVGTELELVPVATVSFADFAHSHPDGGVLARHDPAQPYGRNPYGTYDQGDKPPAGFFTGEVDPRAGAKDRVVGIQIGDSRIAVSLDRLQRDRVLLVEIEGRQAVVWLLPGTASALSSADATAGVEVGATGVFFTERIFAPTEIGFIDAETSSQWDVLGNAIKGPAEGERLEPIEHVDTFWFAWSGYYPETDLID
ncbi:MAG: DUF3179 domain-containing protein [Actinomycetia bacterium]|nr:DUF3179 domain-containing protein [Actinomycetes bacterium]MCP5030232.1 DUF3179 domain-containing protein [Actinomycetes bacterium]